MTDIGSPARTGIAEHRSVRAGGTHKAHRIGTHRVVSPDATCERVRRLMPAMGATRLANITGLDVIGIPVVTVCRPLSRSISVSQGKGLTLAAAKASALMEAAELHSAERPEVRLRRASAFDLRRRECAMAWEGLRVRASASIDDRLPILWAEGNDLLREGASTWVPFCVVHTDWTHPVSAESSWFVSSSNGLASGNHRLEAVSHGICEVVERDATTLWYCSSEAQREATRLNLASVEDAACLEVLERFRAAHVSVAVWDLTSDVGIATFMCMISDDAPSAIRAVPPFAGEGCHPTREVALLRALTEAAQSRLTFIAGSRDDVRGSEYARRLDTAFIQAKGAMVRAGAGFRRFLDVPTWEGETLEDDVAWELERLRAAGVQQVVAIDLTSREMAIPVVRIVVPGLEGIGEVPGYVPGPRARARLARASS